MPTQSRKVLHQQLIRHIHHCRRCALCRGRLNPVVGAGSLHARIMLIGEAPGYHEDRCGLPFAGRSGEILDRLLEATGLRRSQVYITSILKCRPPGNRNPRPGEIKLCTFYLNKQLAIVQPTVIAPLGNFAANYLFTKYELGAVKISEVHGRIFRLSHGRKKVCLVPQFHPAVAVYNIHKFPILRKDFKILKNLA